MSLKNSMPNLVHQKFEKISQKKNLMKSPAEVFSDWADLGKDVGMEKNHFEPVLEMINLFKSKNEFTSIDAGCGNGWLVRYLSNYKKCKSKIV